MDAFKNEFVNVFIDVNSFIKYKYVSREFKLNGLLATPTKLYSPKDKKLKKNLNANAQ